MKFPFVPTNTSINQSNFISIKNEKSVISENNVWHGKCSIVIIHTTIITSIL